MERRKLGSQGFEVPAIGLGTMGMTGFPGTTGVYGAPDEAESIATIHRALDLGIDLFDTAEIYGPHDNEVLLAKALAGRRDRALIATKFGFRMAPDGSIAGVDGRPENVRRALDGCLQRLKTDHIDLWYQHRRDREVPIEDTVGAMAEQVKAGKVRFLGLSEMSAATLRRAHAVHPITALQSEWSIWERNLEQRAPDGGPSIVETCRELGIGVVPYSPLGRGFLGGNLPDPQTLPQSDYRRFDPRFQGDNLARNVALLEPLEQMAARLGSTPAAVAIAWLLDRGEDVIPLVGMGRPGSVDRALDALDVHLTSDDVAELDAAFPIGAASGTRYPEEMMSRVHV